MEGVYAMPSKIVDFSARSQILRDEPFHLHFWELTLDDVLNYLRDPRTALAKMGIELPEDCRIETIIENHDWLSQHTNGLTAANGTIVCNVGGGNVARNYYKVSMYAHNHDAIGYYKKTLLHEPTQEERSVSND
jgi:hypothetical protein